VGKISKEGILLWLQRNNLKQKFLRNSYNLVLVFSGTALPSKSAPPLAVLYGPARPLAGYSCMTLYGPVQPLAGYSCTSLYGPAWLLLYGPSTRPLLEQSYSPVRGLSGCFCTALAAACPCCWVWPELGPFPLLLGPTHSAYFLAARLHLFLSQNLPLLFSAQVCAHPLTQPTFIFSLYSISLSHELSRKIWKIHFK
jgi:hypothetical protein